MNARLTLSHTMIAAVAAAAVMVSPLLMGPADADCGMCSVGHTEAATPHKDIVDTALGAGGFTVLHKAVEAAGLVDALRGEGPFTVFAPTDDAFAKLPEEQVAALLKPENRDMLQAVLTYHVVPGRLTAQQVAGLTHAQTLNGQRLDIKQEDGAVYIGNARVLKTNVMASNGVIHVIDTPILPATSSLAEVAANAGSFGTLIAAAEAAGLGAALSGDEPLTVFAPTDEAFAKLPAGTVESLLEPANRDRLTAILKYHVLPGRVYSDQAIEAGKAETLHGGHVTIKAHDGQVMVDNARVISADIEARNGVIHVIDTVILPGE